MRLQLTLLALFCAATTTRAVSMRGSIGKRNNIKSTLQAKLLGEFESAMQNVNKTKSCKRTKDCDEACYQACMAKGCGCETCPCCCHKVRYNYCKEGSPNYANCMAREVEMNELYNQGFGCVEGNCPGPNAGLNGAPTKTCSELKHVTNGPNDPISCVTEDVDFATHFKKDGSDGNENRLTCQNAVTREDCNNIKADFGNECMWYSYGFSNQGVEAGRCRYNPCSYVNDGSCTLQATGGRCVWYANPNKPDGIHPPNPHGNFKGCYISPCNNPDPIPLIKDVNVTDAEGNDKYPALLEMLTRHNYKPRVPDMVRGCEAMNTKKGKTGHGYGYKCQWCNMRVEGSANSVMGCQNVETTSPPGSARMERFPEVGKKGCLNQFCWFYNNPNRTNSVKYERLFGDGKEQNLRVCRNGKVEWKYPHCHEIGLPKDEFPNDQGEVMRENPRRFKDPLAADGDPKSAHIHGHNLDCETGETMVMEEDDDDYEKVELRQFEFAMLKLEGKPIPEENKANPHANVANVGTNCWWKCDKTAGACPQFCGAEGGCCRKGDPECANGAGCNGFHCCTSLN